jgi:orotidine-5'-phosphate decarboxylase
VNPVLVALDVETAHQALALVDRLRGAVGGFKIGTQLFTAEGPAIVRSLAEQGERVFLDLKFHDIPNTVAGAVMSAVTTGAWMIDVHASGGRQMMRAAADAATRAATQRRREKPRVIGVTVLTSLDAAALQETGVVRSLIDQVVSLARLAQDSGLDGVVASPQEVRAIRAACGPDFLIVTPGIRPRQAAADDQARTMAPAEAIEAGASFLVVGRPITAAPDPRAAAEAISREADAVLQARMPPL